MRVIATAFSQKYGIQYLGEDTLRATNFSFIARYPEVNNALNAYYYAIPNMHVIRESGSQASVMVGSDGMSGVLLVVYSPFDGSTYTPYDLTWAFVFVIILYVGFFVLLVGCIVCCTVWCLRNYDKRRNRINTVKQIQVVPQGEVIDMSNVASSPTLQYSNSSGTTAPIFKQLVE